jgi:hypothetical protein
MTMTSKNNGVLAVISGACLAAVSCGPGPTTPDSGSTKVPPDSGTSSALTVDDFVSQLPGAYCNYISRCCSPTEVSAINSVISADFGGTYDFSTTAHCESAVTDAFSGFNLICVPGSVNANVMAFESTKGAACLNDLKSGACNLGWGFNYVNGPLSDPNCIAAISGTVENGSECATNADNSCFPLTNACGPCGLQSFCSSNNICGPDVASGNSCYPTTCQQGQYCNGMPGTCTPEQQAGTSCTVPTCGTVNGTTMCTDSPCGAAQICIQGSSGTAQCVNFCTGS